MPSRERSSPDPHDLVALGVIRRPHGVRGEASVEPWTDTPSRFESLDKAFLVSPDQSEVREISIDGARFHGDRVLIHIGGIDSPEEMRKLQDWSIEVSADDVRELEQGEFFLHDLAGLDVFDAAGASLGKVVAIEDGATVLLVVEKPDGRRFDVPFAEAICREIDLDRHRLVVDLPEGLENLEAVEEVPEGREIPLEAEDEEVPAAPLSLRQRVDIVTIFPRMFDALLEEGVVARAKKSGVLEIRVWDLRDFATDRHRSTDDEPYGGGAGMVMLAEPIFRCVEAIRATDPQRHPHMILMSPQGKLFDQEEAKELAKAEWLVFLCGRYEGIDERVREEIVQEELSVGEFVVSGGELPAMLVVDAVARMIEGVVGDRNSVEADSFYNGLLDYPHYTRPAELRGKSVPEVLLSGHAEKIRKWRKEQSIRATLEKRPDLIERAELDAEGRAMLDRIRGGKTKDQD